MKAPRLTAGDWMEIYYALEFKRDHSPATSTDKLWRAHLTDIMERIGPDGCNMAPPDPPRPQVFSAEDIEELSKFASDLRKIPESAEVAKIRRDFYNPPA